ncbi:MAG TPA: APC family permease [Vicinamibacteria bacterium]
MGTTTRDADSALVRAIGVWGLAAGIVNVTVGGGIFRLPADVAAALGPAAPVAYLVCAVAMGLIVLGFAEAGSRVALTGGPYAYVEIAFGPFAGFLVGVLLWMIGSMAVAAVAVVFATNVAQLVPALQHPVGSAAFLALVFALLGGVNIAGVRGAASLNAVATVAKLLPLLLLCLGGAFAVRASNLAWPHAPATADVARTSTLLIFAFAGVESALAPSGEVKDIARTVPRAVFIALAGTTVLYVGLQVVAQGVLGAELATARTPLADAAGRVFGPGGRTLLLVGAAVSMFGYLCGMILAIPRALFALARDGFLPRVVASVHPRFHTPYVAIAVQVTIACGFAVTSTFERLAILANLTLLLLYGACGLAAWQLRRRRVQAGGVPFAVRGGGAAPIAACVVIAWMLTGIRAAEWTAMGIALLVASFVYLVARRRRPEGHDARVAAAEDDEENQDDN